MKYAIIKWFVLVSLLLVLTSVLVFLSCSLYVAAVEAFGVERPSNIAPHSLDPILMIGLSALLTAVVLTCLLFVVVHLYSFAGYLEIGKRYLSCESIRGELRQLRKVPAGHWAMKGGTTWERYFSDTYKYIRFHGAFFGKGFEVLDSQGGQCFMWIENLHNLDDITNRTKRQELLRQYHDLDTDADAQPKEADRTTILRVTKEHAFSISIKDDARLQSSFMALCGTSVNVLADPPGIVFPAQNSVEDRLLEILGEIEGAISVRSLPNDARPKLVFFQRKGMPITIHLFHKDKVVCELPMSYYALWQNREDHAIERPI